MLNVDAAWLGIARFATVARFPHNSPSVCEMSTQPGDTRISLSVIVPAYNEQYLVTHSLERLKSLADHEFISRIQVIVVDDASTDRTRQVLADFEGQCAFKQSHSGAQKIEWIFHRHSRNLGKGAAIRTALAFATGQVTVIHDADLEYHPRDLVRMARVFIEENVDAVFGSRFAGGEIRRALLFRHQLGNKFLTFCCNLVSNLNLTDVWTCYKAVRTDLLKSIPLTSNDFAIEPEITIKLAKRDARIFELLISYFGRTYTEGKKINWRDGFAALSAILRFALSDNIYAADAYGSQMLARLARAGRFNSWMVDTIRPFCGERVLEIGGGVGNLTRELVPRTHYVASDVNPLYLATLSNLAIDRPYMHATYCDVADLLSFPQTEGKYDTVICINVLEHLADDHVALSNIKSVLADEGRAIILVPQGPANMGTLDEVLGHKRRYTRQTLSVVASDCGLKISKMMGFNRIGTLAWYLNGRILRRRNFGLIQIWALNAFTPLFRLLDRLLPLSPLSLIAILEKKD